MTSINDSHDISATLSLPNHTYEEDNDLECVYLNTLEKWLEEIRLPLNVNKSAVLVFPLRSPVYLTLCYQNKEVIPQVEQTKYLGVIYDKKLSQFHLKGEASIAIANL